jgi:hypothetical protein
MPRAVRFPEHLNALSRIDRGRGLRTSEFEPLRRHGTFLNATPMCGVNAIDTGTHTARAYFHQSTDFRSAVHFAALWWRCGLTNRRDGAAGCAEWLPRHCWAAAPACTCDRQSAGRFVFVVDSVLEYRGHTRDMRVVTIATQASVNDQTIRRDERTRIIVPPARARTS